MTVDRHVIREVIEPHFGYIERTVSATRIRAVMTRISRHSRWYLPGKVRILPGLNN